jgi:hypothetical protein
MPQKARGRIGRGRRARRCREGKSRAGVRVCLLSFSAAINLLSGCSIVVRYAVCGMRYAAVEDNPIGYLAIAIVINRFVRSIHPPFAILSWHSFVHFRSFPVQYSTLIISTTTAVRSSAEALPALSEGLRDSEHDDVTALSLSLSPSLPLSLCYC